MDSALANQAWSVLTYTPKAVLGSHVPAGARRGSPPPPDVKQYYYDYYYHHSPSSRKGQRLQCQESGRFGANDQRHGIAVSGWFMQTSSCSH